MTTNFTLHGDNGGNRNDGSVISQRLLEQNEDILAAIVENLQIGRLDDCIQHYTVLQNNLIQLATELDNYPSTGEESSDAYDFLTIFPDELMRKDILENFLTMEEKESTVSPSIPPCEVCYQNKITAEECRMILRHIEPNHQLNNLEKTELIHATQVVLARQKQTMNGKNQKAKRQYKRWNYEEMYTLELAIAVYGMNYQKLAPIFEERSENARRSAAQVKNFIRKKKLKTSEIRKLDDLLANPPAGYIPPAQFAHLFSHRNTPVMNKPLSATAPNNSNSTNTEVLVARQTKNNFLSLIALAAGYQLPKQHTETNFSDHDTAEDAKKMKETLFALMNNNSSSFLSSNPTASHDQAMLVGSTIPSVGTLTNQFIFPQSTLFDEALNKQGNPNANNKTTNRLEQKLSNATLANSALLGLNPTLAAANQSNQSTIPSLSSVQQLTSIATATQIVAANAAAEAAGIKLPSISTALPSVTSQSTIPEDHSVASLRLKASNTKNRSEQAKLLLQYYQNNGYHSVPPFARPGLDKLKQKQNTNQSPEKPTRQQATVSQPSTSLSILPSGYVPAGPIIAGSLNEKEKKSKSRKKATISTTDTAAEAGGTRKAKTKQNPPQAVIMDTTESGATNISCSSSVGGNFPTQNASQSTLEASQGTSNTATIQSSNYHQLQEFDKTVMTMIPDFGHDFSFL